MTIRKELRMEELPFYMFGAAFFLSVYTTLKHHGSSYTKPRPPGAERTNLLQNMFVTYYNPDGYSYWGEGVIPAAPMAFGLKSKVDVMTDFHNYL